MRWLSYFEDQLYQRFMKGRSKVDQRWIKGG
jgi:hypothetical protein